MTPTVNTYYNYYFTHLNNAFQDIDERKKAIERNLKEKTEEIGDERFERVKNLLRSQNSVSDVIKSETSSLRDLLKSTQSSVKKNEIKSKKATRNMIEALAKLNSISAILLRDNERTKSSVRELPDSVRSIIRNEMSELREILDEQVCIL